MQRLIKSLTGSSPSNTTIQSSIAEAKSELASVRGNLQHTRQYPQLQTFESVAKSALKVSGDISKIPPAIQEYGKQQSQAWHISLPEATMTQLQEIVTSSVTSTARITEGLVGARSHAYPDGIVFYVDQLSGTLDTIDAQLAQLTEITATIQEMVDKAEAPYRALQAQRKAESDRRDYLASYGGIDPVQIIAQVQAGTYPSVPANIIKHKGETVLFYAGARLSEDRTTSQHVGGSAGVSVPLGHGFRFRTGSYHGHTIHSEHLTQIDVGNLIVTTQRIVFVGGKSTITIPVAKVLHTILYKDGVDVRAENRKKREVFLVQQPVLINTYILIACHLLTA